MRKLILILAALNLAAVNARANCEKKLSQASARIDENLYKIDSEVGPKPERSEEPGALETMFSNPITSTIATIYVLPPFVSTTTDAINDHSFNKEMEVYEQRYGVYAERVIELEKQQAWVSNTAAAYREISSGIDDGPGLTRIHKSAVDFAKEANKKAPFKSDVIAFLEDLDKSKVCEKVVPNVEVRLKVWAQNR